MPSSARAGAVKHVAASKNSAARGKETTIFYNLYGTKKQEEEGLLF
jgi:hypothetical protein